jgi:multidrug efflux pump subunit AcrB
MKKNIIHYIIEKKLFIYMLIVFTSLGGVFSYRALPKQNFPEVVFPVAVVTAVYPGASAEDMEELVTDKIEDEIVKIDGYDTSRSETLDNLSIVMVQLDMNLSEKAVDKSFDELRRKMNDLRPNLPSGLARLEVNTEAMDTNIALIAVSGNELSNDVLAQRSEDLKEALQDLKGIKRVDALGKKESRVNVQVDLAKLNHLNLSLSDLASIIQAQNSIVPTGTLNLEGEKITVNTNGRLENLQALKDIIIAISPDGQSVITLSDVSDISLSPDKDLSGYKYNGQDAVLIALYADKGVNIVSMGDGIRSAITEFEENQLEEIQVKEVYFQPDVVDGAISGFEKNLFASIALVLLVIMVGMNIRNGLVVSLAIPLIILANFMMMQLFGLDVQFVSLAALIIVLGMLVDNSIVVSDSIQTRLNEGGTPLEAVVQGTKDVAIPAFVSMLTAVAGFLSLLTLSGAYKQLAFSLPVVIITCLVVSYFVSVLITPLMSYLVLKPHHQGNGKIMTFVTDLYDYVFDKAFRHKRLAFIAAILFLAICGRCVFLIEPSIVGKVNKDVVTIDITNYTENNIQDTESLLEQIEAIVEAEPESLYHFESIGTIIPRYDFSLNAMTPLPQTAQMILRVDLEKGGRFNKTGDMVSYLQNKLNTSVKGGRIVVDELGVVNLNTKPIELKVYGKDLTNLNQAIDMVTKEMSSYSDIKNIEDIKDMATYNYYVEMDMKKLGAVALTKAEVQNELNLALMGRDVSVYRYKGKEYPIHLTGQVEDLSDIENLKVKSSVTQKGHSVQDYSTVLLKEQISSITHIGGVRGKVIGAYAKSGASPVALQIQLERSLNEMELPEGTWIEYTGEKHELGKVLRPLVKQHWFL